jgi:hypothetical protein
MSNKLIKAIEMVSKGKVFPYKTTSEIDCDPWTGMGRQQDHYEEVCKRAGLKPQPRISAFFGCWTWPVTYQTEKQQQIVKDYLTDLYNKGLCRYASW